jgi:hypothetical protein
MKNKSLLTVEYGGYHILNPGYVYNRTQAHVFSAFRAFGASAVSYEDLANSLYFDYNAIAPADREQTALTFKNLARRSREELGAVVNINANEYMYGATDWNMYQPDEDSRFLFTDENVPFEQIVLHGSVVYTGYGDNYWHDRTRQMLRSVEYGYVPFYFLTEKDPFEIRNAVGWDGFNATVADSWLETITADYARRQTDLSKLWNVKIRSHKRLDGDFAVTVYENGVRVFVNYSDAPREADGYTVAPGDYCVAAPNGSNG